MGRRALLLMAVCVLTVSGHGFADEPQPGHQMSLSAPAAPSDTQEQFNRLHRQFSDRFHEKMIRMAEDLAPAEIAAAASALWHEVFAGRQDLLSRRSRELLAQLGDASSIDESQYYEVLSKSFDAVEANPAPAPSHLVWSPIGAAAYYLDKTLSAVMCKSALEARAQLLANAQLTWEAIDRDLAKPRLVQRQGPVVFLVDLSRKDDGYRVDKIRWLRPKAMGPVAYYVRPDADPPPAKPSGPLVGATSVADKKPTAPAAASQ